MTMQRYFQDPDAEDLRAKYTEIAETYTELLAEYKTRGWIIAVLVGVSVLLVVLLLVALIVKKPRKAAAEEKEVKEFIPTERRKVEKAKAPVIETEDDLEEIDLEEEELPEIEEDKVKKNDMINDEVKDEDDDFEFIDLDL